MGKLWPPSYHHEASNNMNFSKINLKNIAMLKKKVHWVKVGGSIPACSSDRCYFAQEKKSSEKGSPRSRIPRLVLHPFRPKDKGSPLSDSPFSEEEGKECDMSSDHSKRTISTNSFCSGKKFSSSLRTASDTLSTVAMLLHGLVCMCDESSDGRSENIPLQIKVMH